MYRNLLLIAGLLLVIISNSLAQTVQPDEIPSDTIAQPVQFVLPVINLEDIEGDSESHDISSLLQGSRDVYTSTAGYNFGSARYRVRGYESENTVVMINGLRVNDPETGRAFYSVWGGLNDATRMSVGYDGIGVTPETFGGVGGATNITARASLYSPGTRLTYSNSNRSYAHRAMFTHSTGLQENGWSLTLSGSRRSAQDGYVTGTFYDAWSYFVSAEKKLNNRHSVGFLTFGAPSKTGRPGVATQEIYDLTGDNFYNPNWGYQNGEVRNSRVNGYHTPWLMLNHYFNVKPGFEIQTSAGYTFGTSSSTALNWFDATRPDHGPGPFDGHDPRPDYYRYLPSYFANDPAKAAYYTNLWKTDKTFRQIDWDRMYQYNMKNLHTQKDANGIAGNDVEGLRAMYMVEDRRTDRNQFVFNTFTSARVNNFTKVSGGLNASMAKTRQFKVIDDLLGSDWWVDIDQFALRDATDPDFAQNDLENPNRLVKEGDKFGYDFTGNINQYEAFAQAEWVLSRWDFYLGANLIQTNFWRTGHMRNGRFPENSLGDSDKQHFTNYGIKGGSTFKLTGRHYFTANAAYVTRAPFFRDAYVSSRVREDVIPVLKSEEIMTGDVSYIIRNPFLKSRFSLFYSQFKDQTWSRSFYHEEYRTFVNYNMYGVNQTHMGVELGIDIKLSPTLEMTLVAGTGDYVYSNRPTVTITRDNDRELLAEERTVYWKNYKVGGMTHTAGSVGLRYNSPKFWFIGSNVNYFDDIYLEINPDRRTEDALKGFLDIDEGWQKILEQEKLQRAFVADLYAGKSWRIRNNYNITLNVSVNNLLDTKNFSIGGFEQLRYDSSNIDRFGPKYFYMYGRTYFVNIAFRM
jgi:hypothetical protein